MKKELSRIKFNGKVNNLSSGKSKRKNNKIMSKRWKSKTTRKSYDK
jgi:hypothetical protein